MKYKVGQQLTYVGPVDKLKGIDCTITQLEPRENSYIVIFADKQRGAVHETSVIRKLTKLDKILK